MDREPLPTEKLSPFKNGDSIEKLQQLTQQAVAEGRQDDNKIYISIPVDNDMTYWGTGIWHFTEDGRMERANVLFSEILSVSVNRNVRVNGYCSRRNAETGVFDNVITAVITD